MRISKSLHKQVLLTSLVFASTQIVAMDLGVIGNTYQIAEQDAVEQIKAKLLKIITIKIILYFLSLIHNQL